MKFYNYVVNNQNKLRGYLRRLKADELISEDVMQDLLLYSFQTGDRYNYVDNIQSFAFNKVRWEYIRSKTKDKKHTHEDLDNVVLFTKDTPESEYIKNEQLGSVRSKINTILKNKQRDAVVAWMDNDTTLADLADKAGTSRDTYKANFRWGLLNLKPELEPLVDTGLTGVKFIGVEDEEA